MNRKMLTTVLVTASLSTPAGLLAETWEKTAAVYAWGTWIAGDASFGRVESSVKVTPSDVVGALEMGAMGRFRVDNGSWAVVFDGMYASFGGAKDGPPKTTLDLNQYVFQLDAARRISGTTEALLGVRWVRLESTLDLGANGPVGGAHIVGDASFWDPVVGVRTLAPLAGRWRLQAQADIGGGANMDLTWQAMVNLGWQGEGRTAFWFGYRALNMDFDDAGGKNRFGMATTTHGPVAGVAYRF